MEEKTDKTIMAEVRLGDIHYGSLSPNPIFTHHHPIRGGFISSDRELSDEDLCHILMSTAANLLEDFEKNGIEIQKILGSTMDTLLGFAIHLISEPTDYSRFYLGLRSAAEGVPYKVLNNRILEVLKNIGKIPGIFMLLGLGPEMGLVIGEEEEGKEEEKPDFPLEDFIRACEF